MFVHDLKGDFKLSIATIELLDVEGHDLVRIEVGDDVDVRWVKDG